MIKFKIASSRNIKRKGLIWIRFHPRLTSSFFPRLAFFRTETDYLRTEVIKDPDETYETPIISFENPSFHEQELKTILFVFVFSLFFSPKNSNVRI